MGNRQKFHQQLSKITTCRLNINRQVSQTDIQTSLDSERDLESVDIIIG